MLLIPANCHCVSLGSKTERVEFLFDEKIFEKVNKKLFWVLL